MATGKKLKSANLPKVGTVKAKRKAIKRADASEIELHPDAWERFERGLKQIGEPKRKPK